MKVLKQLAVAVALACAASAHAQYSDNVIKIGVLNDQSGTYADLAGPGSVVAARMAVANALQGARQSVDDLVIPWCTYTDPEIAHVGLHVREAMDRGIPVSTYTVPMHAVDRAVLDGEDTGFVKLHVADGGDRILGATIVAHHAGEMIGQVTQAMVCGVGMRDLARVMHPYPTQSAAIGAAAAAWCRDHGERSCWHGWSISLWPNSARS